MGNHLLPAGASLPKLSRGGAAPFSRARLSTALGVLTCEEADTPQAGVQGHLDLRALVLGQDHTLLQVQPVVGADRDAQEPQATDGKDTAQQGQGLPPAGTHLPRQSSGRPAAEVPPRSGRWRQERR